MAMNTRFINISEVLPSMEARHRKIIMVQKILIGRAQITAIRGRGRIVMTL